MYTQIGFIRSCAKFVIVTNGHVSVFVCLSVHYKKAAEGGFSETCRLYQNVLMLLSMSFTIFAAKKGLLDGARGQDPKAI